MLKTWCFESELANNKTNLLLEEQQVLQFVSRVQDWKISMKYQHALLCICKQWIVPYLNTRLFCTGHAHKCEQYNPTIRYTLSSFSQNSFSLRRWLKSRKFPWFCCRVTDHRSVTITGWAVIVVVAFWPRTKLTGWTSNNYSNASVEYIK